MTEGKDLISDFYLLLELHPIGAQADFKDEALRLFGEKNRLHRGPNLDPGEKAGVDSCLWRPKRFFSFRRDCKVT